MHVDVFVPLAAKVAADSGGSLTIKIVSGLSDPTRMYQRVTNRESDMVFGLPGYTPDQFLRTRLIELPHLASSPSQGVRMLANALPHALAPDFADVIPLAVWLSDPSVLLSRERSIRTVADLAGLRVRAPDPISGRVLSLWGATPVTLSANLILSAMQKGEIDAALIASSGILSFALETATRSCTVNLPPMLTSFYLLMNRDSWDGLSLEHQSVLLANTGPGLSLAATAAYEKAGNAGLARLREMGTEIISLTPAESESFALPSRAITDETLSNLALNGIDGQMVLDTFHPRLSARPGPNGFEVRLQGGQGLVYELLESANLGVWTSLGTQTAGQDGSASWIPALNPSGSAFFNANIP
jgi:TRAP-type C4-dicarboxylate transport system substrate-binding protein